ncbi:MAG: hypothetical protein LAT81_05020 [Oceanicaulis sp.]|nr:hypothetical protein [Oceanicaulis sp.]
MSIIKRFTVGGLFAVFIINLSGCSTVPASSLSVSQKEYSDHMRNSQRAQLLNNIVALQYHEAPYFLLTNSIVSQLSKETSLSSSFALGPASDSDLGSIGGSISFRETPTVTYTPLQGESFTRQLLTPLSPALVLALAESGWPVDLLLNASVRSINAVRNDSSDPSRFQQLSNQLRVLQQKQELAVKVLHEEDTYRALFLVSPNLSSEGAKRIEELHELLGINNQLPTDFTISYKAFPTTTNDLAIITRSLLEILAQAGSAIHTTENVSDNQLKINRGPTLPAHTLASTQYRGEYFWIEQDDKQSARLFLLLQLLFELNNTSDVGGSPILSIGTR